MSILEKLSIISDRLDDSDLNLDYIDVAAIFFMNSLPYEISKEYFTEHTFNNDGIACGTKYSDVLRNGEECRKIRSSLRFRAKKENSQYRATENDPVFYKKAGVLYVLPEKQSDSDEFIVTKIPETFIEKSETTPVTGELINAPKDSEQIILLYSGYIIIYKKARDSREKLITDISEIDNAITDISFDLTAFTDTIEALDETIPQLDFAEATEALNNAKDFIGKAMPDVSGDYEIPQGAFWLDDEDPEMVQSSASLATTEINRSASEINKEISKLKGVQESINAKLTKFSAKSQEKMIQLEVKMKQLQQISTKIDSILRKNQIESLYYQSLIQESVSLYQRYQSEFSNFLGIYGSQENNRAS